VTQESQELQQKNNGFGNADFFKHIHLISFIYTSRVKDLRKAHLHPMTSAYWILSAKLLNQIF